MKSYLNESQIKSKAYYDRGSRKLSDLNIGDRVYVRDQIRKIWKKGIVIDKRSDRSYIVKFFETGQICRSNRRFLRIVKHQVVNKYETYKSPTIKTESNVELPISNNVRRSPIDLTQTTMYGRKITKPNYLEVVPRKTE